MQRRPIVGVLGSGTNEHANLAIGLGRWLAMAGVHLLTGGGGGVMGSVSKAFYEVKPRAGFVIGIIPSKIDDPQCKPKSDYPNPWVEIPIQTHLPLSGFEGMSPLSRNHINVLTSDVLIALPGGSGTLSEVALALRYERPIIAYIADETQELIFGNIPYVTTQLEEVQMFVQKHIQIMK